MSLAIVLLVLLAGLIHAVWNAMAKGIASQPTSFALMNVGIAVVSWFALPFIGLPRAAAWPFVLASTACHIGYELFLMGSYERANFSRAYPIARGNRGLHGGRRTRCSTKSRHTAIRRGVLNSIDGTNYAVEGNFDHTPKHNKDIFPH